MVYKVIGLMSGSSMDGLDIAYCILEETGGKWNYTIEIAECISFTKYWNDTLKKITEFNVPEFAKINTSFGKWIGEKINEFIDKYNLHHQIHLIGSHGHTAFHFPENNTSVQIGCGATIAATTGISIVSDLRIMDMALGGQGAPIVPIAEKLLFPNYKMFLNIGGICNISFQNNMQYIAYDVCPANRVLNELAHQINKKFDTNGEDAKNGKILIDVLEQLNNLEYYKKDFPKSLANEMGTEIIMPILNNANASVQDNLRTMVEHITLQIANQIKNIHTTGTAIKLLVTGGGAFNTFLINVLQQKVQPYNVQVIVPDANVVENKEALAMALIATLRWRNEENVLSSVTGATRNSIGGALWLGNQ